MTNQASDVFMHVNRHLSLIVTEYYRQLMVDSIRIGLAILLIYSFVSIGITTYISSILVQFTFLKNTYAQAYISFNFIRSFLNFFFYAFGVYLMTSVKNPLRRQYFCNHLFLYFIFMTIFWILNLIGSFSSKLVPGKIKTSFDDGFKLTMKNYYHNEDTRKFLNSIQSSYKCCGAKDHTDWFSEILFDSAYLNVDFFAANNLSPLTRTLKGTVQYLIDSLPYSCCNTSYNKPCVFDEVLGDSKLYINKIRDENTGNFYLRGCIQTVFASGRLQFMTTYGDVNLIITCVSIILIVLFRLLQTSIYRANIKGLPFDAAYGYIFVNNVKELLTREEKKRAKLYKKEEQEYQDKLHGIVRVKTNKEDSASDKEKKKVKTGTIVFKKPGTTDEKANREKETNNKKEEIDDSSSSHSGPRNGRSNSRSQIPEFEQRMMEQRMMEEHMMRQSMMQERMFGPPGYPPSENSRHGYPGDLGHGDRGPRDRSPRDRSPRRRDSRRRDSGDGSMEDRRDRNKRRKKKKRKRSSSGEKNSSDENKDQGKGGGPNRDREARNRGRRNRNNAKKSTQQRNARRNRSTANRKTRRRKR